MRIKEISILTLLIVSFGQFVSGQSFSDAYFKELNEQIEISPRVSVSETLIDLKSQEDMTPYDRARVDLLLSRYYIRTDQYYKVIEKENYQEVIDILKENSSEEARSYMVNVSTCFVDKGMFSKGLEILVDCERCAEKSGDRMGQALVYQCYANIYYRQGDQGKALLSLEKAEKIYQEEGVKGYLSDVQNNIAVLYKMSRQYSKAIEYNKKALAYSLEFMDSVEIAESYNNIGNCYSSRFNDANNYEDLQNAIKYFKLSSELKDLYPSINNTAKSNLAAIYNKLEKVEISDKLYASTIANAEKSGSWQYLIEIYRDRENAEHERGDLDAAFKFARKRANILQELDKINRKNSVEEIEIQRQFFESKEKVIEQQNSLLIVTALLLLLTIGIVVAIFRARNRRLSAEKKRMVLENRVLVAQMNPHFIFNALTAIQNSLLQNEPLQTAQYLSRFAKMVRSTFEMTQRESSSLTDEMEVLNSYVDIQKIRFEDRFIFGINVDPDLDADRYMVPAMLLQPLVENSIDHGFKSIDYQGELTVDIKRADLGVEFVVKDNGIGFEPKVDEGLDNKELHALDILKQRLELMGSHSFSISRGSDGVGTVVKFVLKDA